jgi:hypothetical protein
MYEFANRGATWLRKASSTNALVIRDGLLVAGFLFIVHKAISQAK